MEQLVDKPELLADRLELLEAGRLGQLAGILEAVLEQLVDKLKLEAKSGQLADRLGQLAGRLEQLEVESEQVMGRLG